MARLNVATWHQIRPHVHSTGIDVMAVHDLLLDKQRQVTRGANTFTCGDLFAGAWTKLVWHLNEGAWLPVHLADRQFGGDDAAVVRYYAVCGGNYASAWFGNPWWQTAITAWAQQNQPPHAGDLGLALRAPNQFGDEAIRWLMNGTHHESFRDAINDVETGPGVNETDLAAGLWFPPGVPDLPEYLR